MGQPGIELTHLGCVVQDVHHYTTEQLGNLAVFCHTYHIFHEYACARMRAASLCDAIFFLPVALYIDRRLHPRQLPGL